MKKRSVIFVFVLILIATVIFVYLNPTVLAAQAADSDLRPLLGDKDTITLESLYFNLSDDINKIIYRYITPNTDIFYSSAGSPADSHEMTNLVPVILRNNVFPLPFEGVWKTINNPLFPEYTVLAKTFVRPDPSRPYAVVSFVKMDMSKLGIRVQAGTYYPGGTHGVYGPGVIPQNIQQSNILVAAFNGGFMEKDGHYGMVVNHKVYVPLRNSLATLVMYSDGSVKMVDYQGQPLGANVVGIRQNGAFLVRNGVITSFAENSQDSWGRTITNSMYTWRSGIGITKNGNLIYAAGNSLTPQTLAVALEKAGVVDAMQLDINPPWVRFIIYDPLGNGNYSFYPLLKAMKDGGYAYLHGYNKDFFYVYKKT